MKKISPEFLLLTFLILSLVMISPVAAETITIDFEDLSPGTTLSNQYSGVTFQTVPECVKIGNGGPDGDFIRPHSGSQFAYPGTTGVQSITIVFDKPVSRVSLWSAGFTDNYLEVHDISGTHIVNGPIASPPIGDMSQLEYAGSDITSINIRADAIDDLEFDMQDPSVPEFPSISLPITAILGLMVIFGRKK